MDSRTENSAETERLLEMIRGGERLAIDQLFARHRPRLNKPIPAELETIVL
jgi:hypothetical protein